MKNSQTVFISILAAASAGVIIGMLIAPEKGEDLRKNLLKAADDWTRKLADLVKDGKEQIKGLAASAEESVEEIIETKRTKGSKPA